ncbi:hypothetical protein RB195_018340 [Necator americanus]|uniref:Bestrophin homolog n=1 Tax=Necator americanus TaxID=51031 RepID=A0ABR1C9A6_NECAM
MAIALEATKRQWNRTFLESLKLSLYAETEIVEKILLRIQFMFRGIALFLWFSKAIPAYAIYMISIDVELTCVNRADDM